MSAPRTAGHAGNATPMVGAALLAGTANVVMQLGLPAVGHGVVESPVESGRIFDHPAKRTRTTLTYLVVALRGTPQEKRAYRRAVDRVHAQVRSGPDSPVAYRALDPQLQLWVAACLYRGVEDAHEAFLGGLDDAGREELFADAAPLGTTLQVRDRDWPADRAAFEAYWQRGLDRIHVDDTVGTYLHALIDLRFAPRVVQVLLGRFHRFVTTGFLPPRFRDELGLAWTPRQQRRFDRFTAAVGAVVRRLPRPLQEFPFNAYHRDLRRRLRTGRPLV